MGKGKNYSVAVLSAGGVDETGRRINGGLNQLDATLKVPNREVALILSGFNTEGKHDPGFEGDWYDDPRLKKYEKKIQELLDNDLCYIEYAKNTPENALNLYNLYMDNKIKLRGDIVTSNYHVLGAKDIFKHVLGKKDLDYKSNWFGVNPGCGIIKEAVLSLEHGLLRIALNKYLFQDTQDLSPEETVKVYNERMSKLRDIKESVLSVIDKNKN